LNGVTDRQARAFCEECSSGELKQCDFTESNKQNFEKRAVDAENRPIQSNEQGQYSVKPKSVSGNVDNIIGMLENSQFEQCGQSALPMTSNPLGSSNRTPSPHNPHLQLSENASPRIDLNLPANGQACHRSPAQDSLPLAISHEHDQSTSVNSNSINKAGPKTILATSKLESVEDGTLDGEASRLIQLIGFPHIEQTSDKCHEHQTFPARHIDNEKAAQLVHQNDLYTWGEQSRLTRARLTSSDDNGRQFVNLDVGQSDLMGSAELNTHNEIKSPPLGSGRYWARTLLPPDNVIPDKDDNDPRVMDKHELEVSKSEEINTEAINNSSPRHLVHVTPGNLEREPETEKVKPTIRQSKDPPILASVASMVRATLGSRKIDLLVDSGAAISVLSESLFEADPKLKCFPIEPGEFAQAATVNGKLINGLN
jgi:hypothetical protein